MASTYRAVELVGKGGLDKLREVTLPFMEPSPDEVRIRVLATGVGYTDVLMRTGYYPYRPPFPFVPGYEVVGRVDAIGTNVKTLKIGDRVAALTVHGGYAEMLTRNAEEFVKVPDGPSDVDVAAVILNYVTAYQMIHRVATSTPKHSALVTGASGGVGLALIELLRADGTKVIGSASEKNFEAVRNAGATPILGRNGDVDKGVRAVVPDGVDVAFDGIGGASIGQCIGATRRGGLVISYGFTGVVTSTLGALRGLLSLWIGAPLRGRRGAMYGITKLYREDPKPFREDFAEVLKLLAAGAIHPKVVAKLPLLSAIEAQSMLEKGGVNGKIVLVAP